MITWEQQCVNLHFIKTDENRDKVKHVTLIPLCKIMKDTIWR